MTDQRIVINLDELNPDDWEEVEALFEHVQYRQSNSILPSDLGSPTLPGQAVFTGSESAIKSLRARMEPNKE